MVTKLHEVTTALPNSKPSRKLGDHGSALWSAITDEYAIEDAGGVELLTQACQALDRAETLRAAIEKDGATIQSPKGLRDHPVLKHELAARALRSARCNAWALTLKLLSRPVALLAVHHTADGAKPCRPAARRSNAHSAAASHLQRSKLS
jgi:hypothetical protein